MVSHHFSFPSLVVTTSLDKNPSVSEALSCNGNLRGPEVEHPPCVRRNSPKVFL